MPAPAPASAKVAAQPEAAEPEDPPVKAAVEKQETKKANYTVKLMSFEASKKISVVKEVRAATKLGLKEAKELVESAPKVIVKGLPTEEAEAMRTKLEAIGAV